MTEEKKKTTTRRRTTTKKAETVHDKLKSLIELVDDSHKKGLGVVEYEDGKKYTKVSYRLKKAREVFGFDLRIINSIVEKNEREVVVECNIYIKDNGEWDLVQSAHAHEFRDSNVMNTYNYVENAETSAMGRALGGLGIFGEEFASDNEINNSNIHQKEKTNVSTSTRRSSSNSKNSTKKANAEQIASIQDFLNKNKEFSVEDILDGVKAKKLEDLTEKDAGKILDYLKENVDTPL